MTLTLYLGSKNLSSWSFRPWLALRQAGIAFEEVVIPLDTPATKAKILERSPSGRVPALKDGELLIWDSLAILEYVNELAPGAQLWPASREARAVARAVSAEMHSGFAALRQHLPFHFAESLLGRARPPEVEQDIARILEIWSDCRARFGQGGPFLFGAWSAADAMYAPVVSRFLTYGVELSGVPAQYAQAVRALPAWKVWGDAARAELK